MLMVVLQFFYVLYITNFLGSITNLLLQTISLLCIVAWLLLPEDLRKRKASVVLLLLGTVGIIVEMALFAGLWSLAGLRAPAQLALLSGAVIAVILGRVMRGHERMGLERGFFGFALGCLVANLLYQGWPMGLRPVYRGFLRHGTYVDYFGTPADLYGDKHEFLFCNSRHFVSVMRFEQHTFVPTWKIRKNAPWISCDVDNDGKDELVFFNGSTVDVLRFNPAYAKRSRYLRKAHDLPMLAGHQALQMAAGDLDGQDGDELAVFSSPGSTKTNAADKDFVEVKYFLSVLKWQSDRNTLDVIWSDEASLGYHDFGITSPPSLVGIGDMLNTGVSHLIIRDSQSDVSPSRFDLLDWSGKDMRKDKTVILANGRVWPNKENDEPPDDTWEPFVWYDFRVVKMQDETVILAPLSGRAGTYHSLLRISGDIVESVGLTITPVKGIGQVLPNPVHWINLDGKGKGLLHVNAWNEFIFYR